MPPRVPSSQTQKGRLPPRKRLEPLPHLQTWSTRGLGRVWHPLWSTANYDPGQGLVQALSGDMTPLGVGIGDMSTFSRLYWLHPRSPLSLGRGLQREDQECVWAWRPGALSAHSPHVGLLGGEESGRVRTVLWLESGLWVQAWFCLRLCGHSYSLLRGPLKAFGLKKGPKKRPLGDLLFRSS